MYRIGLFTRSRLQHGVPWTQMTVLIETLVYYVFLNGSALPLTKNLESNVKRECV